MKCSSLPHNQKPKNTWDVPNEEKFDPTLYLERERGGGERERVRKREIERE